jgi:hypothetical protein
MIGNCDWDVVARHNVVILSQGLSERPDLGVIIPYDFDYSGIINTDYAVPPDVVPIESVREHYYLGLCRTKEEFTIALKEFSDKKDDFYKVINEFPYLKEKVKKDMINYLDGFFAGFDKRNTNTNKLLNNCLSY